MAYSRLDPFHAVFWHHIKVIVLFNSMVMGRKAHSTCRYASFNSMAFQMWQKSKVPRDIHHDQPWFKWKLKFQGKRFNWWRYSFVKVSLGVDMMDRDKESPTYFGDKCNSARFNFRTQSFKFLGKVMNDLEV
jgi:hypothetical protein